jgi:Glycosyltransferase family 87
MRPAAQMSAVSAALRRLVAVISSSQPVKIVGFIALMALGALSLRISLTNAFLYAHWADAKSYAEGARRVYASLTPYSEVQLGGPYPLDDVAHGFGFVYPPSGAYLLVPFTLEEPFWYVWNALSIVAVVGVVLLIVSRELGRLSVPMAFAVGAVAVTLFQPGLTDLKTGYLSPMVAAAMGSMWVWPRWSAIPSLVFGLIKVFPAAGLLWTIRKRGAWKLPLLVAVLVFAVVTVANPTFLADWLTALRNAEPGCPEFAFVSFGCLGMPLVGYLAAAVLLGLAWRATRDDVSFLLLGLAMTVPYPDIYWGNLMVPMIAGIPLAIRLTRHWLRRFSADPASQHPQPLERSRAAS